MKILDEYMMYKFVLYVFASLIVLISCKTNNAKISHKKGISDQIQFTNKSPIPLIENCKNDHTKACFEETISKLILTEVKKSNFILKNDTLRIGLRINKDGTTKIMENKTKNTSLKNISLNVLNSLDIIQPGYFESTGTYQTVSYYWYIIIANNEITNNFEN